MGERKQAIVARGEDPRDLAPAVEARYGPEAARRWTDWFTAKAILEGAIPDPIDFELRANDGAIADLKRRQREIEARLEELWDEFGGDPLP